MATIVGLFDKLTTAETVVDELGKKGFTRYEISLVASGNTEEYSDYFNTNDDAVDRPLTVGEGGSAGAMAGVVTGLIVGLAALVIPGIGPILAAGPLLAALTGGTVGMVAGAATGGLVAGLIQTGLPEDEAAIYADSIRAGGTLVVVRTSEDVAATAQTLMRDFGAIDVAQRRADPTVFEPIGITKSANVSDTSAIYPPHNSVTAKLFAVIEPACQEHFATQYATHTGITYNGMRPFYRYGFNLATDRRYASATWSEVEADARTLWELRNPNDAWNTYAEAVHFGWECVHRTGNMQPKQVVTDTPASEPMTGLSLAPG